ncbi:MAG: M48 family metallopeptidase [Gammaproteobacteria bacterium]|nr:M48 family metallopeptidase [Gammaproteobacteria bacterium]MBT8111109.1 M48 family metallopeptidase [Gammaproteobacteria bacterium]NND48026.1 M48 family metallopeptidase [Woeseiaceae bacterium]NNL45807.1 M48 family metallopeptidase [Woeseiaceae bacterium]
MRNTATQLPLFSEVDEPDSASGFSVRESGRARRLSIKVFPRGRVEVVVPRRTRPADVREFVEAHRDWIRQARASFAADHPPEPFALPEVVTLSGIAQEFAVHYEPERGARTVRYRTRNGAVVLCGHTRDEKLCVQALKRWLTNLAKREYAPRLRALSGLTGNSFKKMHVRGQRTCWGSHSSTGTISLNFCLLFLDPGHLRYVMIHELCHARHMNHSRRFWSLVARFEPDYRQLDKDLNGSWKRIPTWVGIY